MKLYKIYKLTNLLNEMIYIGYTGQKLIKRITVHTLKSNYYIGNAIREHELENFKVEVLHEVRDKYSAQLLEMMEIWDNNCVRPNGYNLTPGGEGTIGIKHPELIERNKKGHSKEAIEKIRKGMQGNKNAEGRIVSKESREKQRKAMQGKHFSEEVNKKKGTPGNQFAKGKNLGKSNCSHRTDVKIKRLQTRMKKYEQELNKGELKWL